MNAPARFVDPVDPVTEEECLHCDGTGFVDDDYDDGSMISAVEYRCDRCDGTFRAPVDARGRCACEDCLHLPYDERVGSDRPWCESRYSTAYQGIVGCSLEAPHKAHLSARGEDGGRYTWWDMHAYQEPERVTPLQPEAPPADH